jgi:hypothetical protein
MAGGCAVTDFKERPILFSAPMVRAILEGRKTVTRRVVKPQPVYDRSFAYDGLKICGKGKRKGNAASIHCAPLVAQFCPYGKPGDRLWVKESWAQRLDLDHLNGTELFNAGVREAWYWADGPGRTCNTGCAGAAGRVRSSRFMPRWASRITLEVTGVRVERLQDISLSDVLGEGVPRLQDGDAIPISRYFDMRSIEHGRFRDLWQSINGAGSWDANPWVWVVEFRKIAP